MFPGNKSQAERVPKGQSWNSSTNKINTVFKPNYKINIVEINGNQPTKNNERQLIQSLPVPREAKVTWTSVCVLVFWFILKSRQRGGKALYGKRERLQVYSDWRWANKKWVIFCDWLEIHVWISLVGSKLEVGTQNREGLSY